MNVIYTPNFFKFEHNFDFNHLFKMINNHSLPSHLIWQENSEDVLGSIFTIYNVHQVDFFKQIFDLLNKEFNFNNFKSNMDLFISFKNGTKGKSHADKEDVHIFGLDGYTCYLVEDKVYLIGPGDLICIKKNTLHQAFGITPRIIASFGIYS